MIGNLPGLGIFHDALCLLLLNKLLVVADHNEASPWNKQDINQKTAYLRTRYLQVSSNHARMKIPIMTLFKRAAPF
jgi:hypothetical protein